MNTVLKEFFGGYRKGSNSIRANFINIRWVFIFLVFPIMYLVSKAILAPVNFLILIMITFIYNSLVTLYIQNARQKREKMSDVLFYIDIVFILTIVYVFGGIKSDIYFILFFVLCYFGTLTEFRNLLYFSLFMFAAYSMICIYSDLAANVQIDFLFLLQRSLMFVFCTFGVFLVVKELKKYDELHKKEFVLARTDKLTGLYNRHNLEKRLNEDVMQARLTGKPINILIFDLDNFKKFNDSYGHVAGDKLLTLFSDIIRQGIRKSDVAIRYGGEEFLIIIKDLELDVAQKVADRIRGELENQKIYVGKDEDRQKVTVSCGVAQYPKHSLDIKKVIELADKALYIAKNTGKNKVVVSHDDVVEENVG